MTQSQIDSEGSDNIPKKVNYYIKYSSVGIQMFAIVGLGSYGGVKLNTYFGFEKPYLTVVISLVSIVFSMIYAYRQVQR
jgi:hypothetical protein